MKKFFLALLFSLSFAVPAFTQDAGPTEVHVFVRDGCVHCADEKEFLADLSASQSDFVVVYHDIEVPKERELFNRIAEQAELSKSTPITFVGGVIIQGFATADTTGVRIAEVIKKARGLDLPSPEEFLDGGGEFDVAWRDTGCDESGETPCTVPSSEYLVRIPFFGTVNLEQFSLPAITAILGFVDGFNPCAMWVLVTFLIVLLQLGDRRKVWQVAGLFIAAETIMYYMILNVWFTTWDFIGLDKYVTPIVGVIAVGAGLFFLYEGIMTDGTCKVTSFDQQKKTSLRIKNIAAMPFTIATAIAIVGLALSVNIIEFACSIGIPQTFTKILDLNNLSFFPRQGLMAIYIFMYMIDDFIVFALALWSAEYTNLTHKYSRASNVIGGVLMIALGLLLIFYPQALMFG